MVSPWMQHGTILKHIIDIGGPLTANVDRYVGSFPNTHFILIHVLEQLFEIAQGLHYLHSRNIIHGDLRGVRLYAFIYEHQYSLTFIRQTSSLMTNGISAWQTLVSQDSQTRHW
jgi:serine/threonine protein kinase